MHIGSWDFGRIQRGLRRRLASVIAPKESPSPSLAAAFYSQEPTCQIPNLYYLLSKFLGNREHGHYVEVGAYDGIFASNTWGLAARGWHGLLIEPVPHLADMCRRNYELLGKIEVLEIAVGRDEQDVPLHLAGTLTTANTNVYDEYADVEWATGALTDQSLSVECRPLDLVLTEQHVPLGFDLLVVDVEGFETEVFAGFDISKWQPKMMIVELTDTHPDLTATEDADAKLSRSLCEAGYIICFKDSVNTVFIRQDVWEASFTPA